LNAEGWPDSFPSRSLKDSVGLFDGKLKEALGVKS
jgi:hypothetical protein